MALLAHWLCDEADPVTTVVDDVAGTYDGNATDVVAAAAIAPTGTGSLLFNGSSSVVADIANLDLAAPFSVAFWFDSFNSQVQPINPAPIGGVSGAWITYKHYSDTGRFYFGKVGVNEIGMTSEILDDAAHHFAITYDGSDVRFYLDGVLDATVSYSSAFDSFGADYAIGAASGLYWTGSLDDMRVYDHTLSLAEVEALAGLPPSGGNRRRRLLIGS